jgi:hypothetical protein
MSGGRRGSVPHLTGEEMMNRERARRRLENYTYRGPVERLRFARLSTGGANTMHSFALRPQHLRAGAARKTRRAHELER